MKVAVVLAFLGALAVAFGVGMVNRPAGVICAGVEAIVGAYVAAYLTAKAAHP